MNLYIKNMQGLVENFVGQGDIFFVGSSII